MAFRLRSSRRGNAVLEAALVLPILLGLAFGTVEFSHYFYIKHTLQGVARQGARAAIMPDATRADVDRAIADAAASYGLRNASYTVAITPSDIAAAAPGDNVSISVQCNWGAVGVRPMALIGAYKVVKGVAVMRKEGD